MLKHPENVFKPNVGNLRFRVKNIIIAIEFSSESYKQK
jgi:hypothetical protein